MQELRELRQMADWTQTRTARASGVNRAKLSQAECGEIDLSPAEDTAVRRVLLAAVRERAARIQGILSSATSEPLRASA